MTATTVRISARTRTAAKMRTAVRMRNAAKTRSAARMMGGAAKTTAIPMGCAAKKVSGETTVNFVTMASTTEAAANVKADMLE